MKIGAASRKMYAQKSQSLGLKLLRCPTASEIYRVIRLAIELKDCGSFSTAALQSLVERTGYKKTEIMRIMNKYDDVFLAIPASGGYKLKAPIEGESYIEEIGIRLIKQRTFFLMLSTAIPMAVLIIALLGITLTAPAAI